MVKVRTIRNLISVGIEITLDEAIELRGVLKNTNKCFDLYDELGDVIEGSHKEGSHEKEI